MIDIQQRNIADHSNVILQLVARSTGDIFFDAALDKSSPSSQNNRL